MDLETLVRVGVAASGVSPVGARTARDRYGSWAAAARRAPADCDVPPRLREVFAEAERLGTAVLERCAACGVEPWLRGSADWPEGLEQLTDPPELLFTRGRRAALRAPAVAFVGSREASPDGTRWTESAAAELAAAGWLVGSGLARGIDTAAHRGASAEGTTFAVLGCGPDVPYPPENRALQHRIGEEGVLVSEFPPGSPPRGHHFPRRNRILAALVEAVVVVECRLRSGALVTARHALDLGREVFAVPGFPGTDLAEGPLRLIRDGARPVRHAEDLLEDLGGIPGDRFARTPASADAADAPEDPGAGASSEEELADRLGVDPATAREEWARRELLGQVGSRRPFLG